MATFIVRDEDGNELGRTEVEPGVKEVAVGKWFVYDLSDLPPISNGDTIQVSLSMPPEAKDYIRELLD